MFFQIIHRNVTYTIISHLPKKARVCIYGSSSMGRIVSESLYKYKPSIEITSFADTYKSGFFMGKPIINPPELRLRKREFDHVIVASHAVDDICQCLTSEGLNNLMVLVWLYPVPVSKPDTCLIFEHIPKTAGTTFHTAYCAEVFPENERLIVPGSLPRNLIYIQLARHILPNVRIVGGHNCGVLRDQFPELNYMTIIRDPVQRQVSSFLHNIYHQSNGHITQSLSHSVTQSLNKLNMDAYLKQILESKATNAQSTVLLGENANSLPIKAEDIEMYLQKIERRFWLIGITEQFADLLFLLHLKLGWPLRLVKNCLVRKERILFAPSQEQVELINAMNQLDCILYSRLKQKFNETLESTIPSNKVTMLERYRYAMKTIQTKWPAPLMLSVPYRDEEWK